jgi:hypothetical protein
MGTEDTYGKHSRFPLESYNVSFDIFYLHVELGLHDRTHKTFVILD